MFKVGTKIKIRLMSEEEFKAFQERCEWLDWMENAFNHNYTGVIKEIEGDDLYNIFFGNGCQGWFTREALMVSDDSGILAKIPKYKSCANCVHSNSKNTWCVKRLLVITSENVCKYYYKKEYK